MDNLAIEKLFVGSFVDTADRKFGRHRTLNEEF